MKTVKISLVATIAALLAWWLRIPQRISPSHPLMADLLVSLIITVVIQFTWSNEKKKTS